MFCGVTSIFIILIFVIEVALLIDRELDCVKLTCLVLSVFCRLFMILWQLRPERDQRMMILYDDLCYNVVDFMSDSIFRVWFTLPWEPFPLSGIWFNFILYALIQDFLVLIWQTTDVCAFFLREGEFPLKKVFFFFILWIRQTYANVCFYQFFFYLLTNLNLYLQCFLFGTMEASLFKYFIKKKIVNRIIGSGRWSIKHRTIEWISFDRVYDILPLGD